MSKFSIIIPASGTSKTIQKTLISLRHCFIPKSLNKIIISENGPSPKGAQLLSLLNEISKSIYTYSYEANKSNALNYALEKIGSEMVVFFDDDVLIHPQTLISYAYAFEKFGTKFFYTGPLIPDYEKNPPEWLLQHLPFSAKGWNLGSNMQELKTPDALGANWAAFSKDLKDVGFFDVRKGPGTKARGQERDMQERLISKGKTGLYLPDAKIWHYIPNERCSPEWALRRAYEVGNYEKQNKNSSKLLEIKRMLYHSIFKSMVIILNKTGLNLKVGFSFRMKKYLYDGYFEK